MIPSLLFLSLIITPYSSVILSDFKHCQLIKPLPCCPTGHCSLILSTYFINLLFVFLVYYFQSLYFLFLWSWLINFRCTCSIISLEWVGKLFHFFYFSLLIIDKPLVLLTNLPLRDLFLWHVDCWPFRFPLNFHSFFPQTIIFAASWPLVSSITAPFPISKA